MAKAKEWHDLSMYGIRLLVSLSQKDGKTVNTAVLATDNDAFDPEVARKLEAKGFEKKSLEGKLVYTIGSLPSTLLPSILPKVKMYELRSKEDLAALMVKGKLAPYVEPAPEAADEAAPDELDAVDTTVFEDIDAAPAPAKPAAAPATKQKPATTPKAAKAPKAPKAAASKKPRAAKPDVAKKAEPAKKTAAPAAAKPAAPAPTQAAGKPLPGWEKIDANQFEQFLTYEGVSPDARSDYRAAITAMSHHFSFAEVFETEHEIDPATPNKGYGSVLRERLKTETKHKELAKSRIIDLLYGFVKEFLNRDDAQRAVHASFVEERKEDVEKLWDWTTAFMKKFDDQHGGIPNFLTTYPRVVRIAGMRTLFDLVTTDKPRELEAKLKSEDLRFAQDAMPGKQFANYMNPVISKLRRSDDAIEQIRAQRDEVFGKELGAAPAPVK